MNNKPVLNWINGQWLDSGHYLDSINPATYDVIGQFAEGEKVRRNRLLLPLNMHFITVAGKKTGNYAR